MANTIAYFQRFSHDPTRRKTQLVHVDGTDLSGKLIEQLDFIQSHVLHYAGTIFEGARAFFSEEDGKLSIVNGQDNAKRFLKSMEKQGLKKSKEKAKSLPIGLEGCLDLYDSKDEVFVNGKFDVKKIVDLMAQVIQFNTERGLITPEDNKIYLRPVMYRATHPDGSLGVKSMKHDIVFSILVQEWGSYLPNGMRLIVHPEGNESPTRRYKIGANYAFGQQAKNAAIRYRTHEGIYSFDDALITDHKRRIEEATGANFFAFGEDGTLYTPPLDQFLLPGITRRTVIALAKNAGYDVVERNIHLSELEYMTAAFLTGTATQLRSIDFVYDPREQKVYEFDKNHKDVLYLQDQLNNLVLGKPVEGGKNKELQQKARRVIVPL